jgi:hypothetical protein
MIDKKTTAKKIVITLSVASPVTIEKLKQESDNLKFSQVLQISNQWSDFTRISAR